MFYAKDRVPPLATGAAAAAAIEAAQAMQQYNAAWEPEEFDETATEVNEASKDKSQDFSAMMQQDETGFVYDSNSGAYAFILMFSNERSRLLLSRSDWILL